MHHCIQRGLAIIVRFACLLRYRIKVIGKEVLNDPDLRDKSVLVLSNHPAMIDPLVLFTIFILNRPILKLRPVVFEGHPKLLLWLIKWLNPILVPDFDNNLDINKLKLQEEFHHSVIKALKTGENILIYPAGATKEKAWERIGGRSGTHRIIQEITDVEVVLVRITGLWGSLFSKVYPPGHFRSLRSVTWRSLKILLQNLIFFVPKRQVIVEFEKAPKDFPWKTSKIEFTRYLENWYNQYPVGKEKVSKEPLQLIHRAFWSKKKPVIPSKEEIEIQVPRDLGILNKLSEITGLPIEKIHENQDIVYDLGLDSIDKIEIFIMLRDQYDMDKTIMPIDLVTVKDLFIVASKKNQFF